jgi:hypothetical protein
MDKLTLLFYLFSILIEIKGLLKMLFNLLVINEILIITIIIIKRSITHSNNSFIKIATWQIRQTRLRSVDTTSFEWKHHNKRYTKLIAIAASRNCKQNVWASFGYLYKKYKIYVKYIKEWCSRNYIVERLACSGKYKFI